MDPTDKLIVELYEIGLTIQTGVPDLDRLNSLLPQAASKIEELKEELYKVKRLNERLYVLAKNAVEL